MQNKNFMYEINFHMWRFDFIYEILVSYTNILLVKFGTSSFHM